MKTNIINLKSYDFVLTYTWFKNNNHGICGHTFEVIDYFWILKDHFNICIMIADNLISYDIFRTCIIEKYDFNKDEIDIIMNNTIFSYNPLMVICNNIIFTDGNKEYSDKYNIVYNKKILFACGDKSIENNTDTNTYILQDNRIYNKTYNGINYIKKILLDRYKKIHKSDNKILLYGTKNCRLNSDEYYKDLLKKYHKDFILLSSNNNQIDKRIQNIPMPLKNIFERFDTYIYTPLERKFDCSPRFIVECKFYNKEVIYDIDYLDEDLGLYYRKYDIDHNFDSLFLRESDDIINILKYIKGN